MHYSNNPISLKEIIYAYACASVALKESVSYTQNFHPFTISIIIDEKTYNKKFKPNRNGEVYEQRITRHCKRYLFQNLMSMTSMNMAPVKTGKESSPDYCDPSEVKMVDYGLEIDPLNCQLFRLEETSTLDNMQYLLRVCVKPHIRFEKTYAG